MSLVTMEEPSWESFSEEEPRVPVAVATIVGTTVNKKERKVGGKTGQGNIKSFFDQR